MADAIQAFRSISWLIFKWLLIALVALVGLLGLAIGTTQAVIREIRASGVETLAGIARVLQTRGVKTPAGRTDWQPVQVSRLLAA